MWKTHSDRGWSKSKSTVAALEWKWKMGKQAELCIETGKQDDKSYWVDNFLHQKHLQGIWLALKAKHWYTTSNNSKLNYQDSQKTYLEYKSFSDAKFLAKMHFCQCFCSGRKTKIWQWKKTLKPCKIWNCRRQAANPKWKLIN